MREEILRMEGVRCAQDGVALIQDMYLTLFKGETMGLLINNAYRRSCVASLLCGLLQVDAGRVYYNDALIENDAYGRLCQRRVASIDGQTGLIDTLSVAENIFLLRPAARTYLVRPGMLRRQAAELLRFFGTAIDPSAPLRALTPLERATVLLIKAYARGARVVLLNDLSRTLSPMEIGRLMNAASRLKEEGVGIFLADAYWDVLVDYSDRLSVYDNGRIVKVFRRGEYDAAALAAFQTASAAPAAPRGPAASPAALSFRNVGTKTLRDVSFSVHGGEILCILDMDGSGNDQIASLLYGACPLRQGGVFLRGAPYTRRSPMRALRRGLGVINENPTKTALCEDMSVLDNLALPISSRSSGFFMRARFLKSLRAQCADLLPPAVLDRQNLKSLDQETLQRLVYYRWRVLRPSAMVLLRPLSVADARLSLVTRELIADLARRGCAILILSSNATEARQLAQHTLILKNGALQGDGA